MAQPLNHSGGSRGPRLLDGLLADDDNHWQVITGNAQDGYTVTYKGWRILGFTWRIARTIKHPMLRGTYLTAGDSAGAQVLTYSSLCDMITADIRVRGPLYREHQALSLLPSRHDDSDPGVAKHIMDTLLGQTWEVNGDEIIRTEWTIQRLTPQAICEDIYLKV
jgi:hypothetical protein